MNDNKAKAFLKKISVKLAILLGSTVGFQSTSAAVQTPQGMPSDNPTAQTSVSEKSWKLPGKLVLKKTNAGVKLIALHSSHSSHASHGSHGSHSSHSSHASRAM